MNYQTFTQGTGIARRDWCIENRRMSWNQAQLEKSRLAPDAYADIRGVA